MKNYRLFILALILGLIVGVFSLGYAKFVNWVVTGVYLPFIHTFPEKRIFLIFIPTLGGLIVGLLIQYGSMTAKGHGVPAIIETISSRESRLSTRDLWVEGLASALTIGSGGSAGRIGPVVEIGAGIGDLIGHRFSTSLELYRTILGCGAAAGIAAIFSAPLGGIMFVLEIVFKGLEKTRIQMIIISAVSADAIVRMISGYRPIFQLPGFVLDNPVEYLFYILLGIGLGIFSVIVILTLYHLSRLFDGINFIPFWIKPAIGGLGVGLIAYNIPDVLGTGIRGIGIIFKGNYILYTLFIVMVLKTLATAFTLGSGGSGGIFAPTLFIGTCGGIIYGEIMQNIFPEYLASPFSYGLAGMAGLIGGVTQAPLTAVLIIFELTRNYNLILPLLLVAVIASNIASNLLPDSIYSPRLFYRELDFIKDGGS